ncbi:winged helix-turn-helix domain-containing protein [Microbispora sp. NPDC004025]
MDTPLQLIRVDEPARRAWQGDHELTLTPRLFDLLALLVAHAGRVVAYEEILRRVWHSTWIGGMKTVHVHVGHLRRALGDDADQPRYITTVRGVGLRLADDAVAASPTPEPPAYQLPLRIDRHGQTIYDADDVLVAAAMTPRAALWLVEVANTGATA